MAPPRDVTKQNGKEIGAQKVPHGDPDKGSNAAPNSTSEPQPLNEEEGVTMVQVR